MDELINLVSEKTGISQEQARQAVETVMGYLKDKLPKPIASQVEKALEGGGDIDVEKLSKGLGDLLGGS